jgi:hypothetical protein
MARSDYRSSLTENWWNQIENRSGCLIYRTICVENLLPMNSNADHEMPPHGQCEGSERVGKRQGVKRIRPLCSWVRRNRSKHFFYFNTHRTFLDFYRTKSNIFLNSVLTKILQMKASFLRFFILNFLKFLKSSNSTGRFSVDRWNRTRPVLSVFTKIDQFSSAFQSLVIACLIDSVLNSMMTLVHTKIDR